MNNLLTLDEAAARLQTSRRTLRRAIAEGRLRAVRLGESARSDRIDPDDLAAYVRNSKTEAQSCQSIKEGTGIGYRSRSPAEELEGRLA